MLRSLALIRHSLQRMLATHLEVMRPTIILAAVLLTLAACHEPEGDHAQETAAASVQEREHSEELGKDEREFVAVLRDFSSFHRRAEAVTLREVVNQFDPTYAQFASNRRVVGYPITRTVTLSQDAALPLLQVLSDRATYFPPGEQWMCIFEPHYVVEIAAGDERGFAIICLKCGDVVLKVGATTAKSC